MYTKIIVIAFVAVFSACLAEPKAEACGCDPCVVQRCHTFPIHSSVGIKTTHRIIPSNTCGPYAGYGYGAGLGYGLGLGYGAGYGYGAGLGYGYGAGYGYGLGLGYGCGGLYGAGYLGGAVNGGNIGPLGAIQGGYYGPYYGGACGY